MIHRELSMSRKAGRAQANVINETVDGVRGSSQSPLRSALKSSGMGVRRDLSESFARTSNDKLEQLQRQLIDLQTENDRLKHDASLMSQNYNRKIEAQDDTIKTLGQRVDHNQGNPEYEEMLMRENDALKGECSLLRDKVASLSNEIDNVREYQGQADVTNALDHENQRLRSDMNDKEREFTKQIEQMRALITDKDVMNTKQKNEWAEIYGNMKREADGLKRDIRMLNKENERLVKQIETGKLTDRNNAPLRGDLDLKKRLQKRELECQALWETLRDLYNGSQAAYDTRQLLDVLAVRALDVKARKKLNIR